MYLSIETFTSAHLMFIYTNIHSLPIYIKFTGNICLGKRILRQKMSLHMCITP